MQRNQGAQNRTDVLDKTFSKRKNPHFELYWFTYQEVSNEAYEEDHRQNEKSHSKGYSQDSRPRKY